MWIEKTIKAFIGLAVLFFVCRYPDNVVHGIQAFVDAASKVADSLSHLHANTKGTK
jgi:hypothetical protein